MHRKDKYYISGAVTSDHDFRTKFSKAEKLLKDRGLTVLNPVKGEKEGKQWSYYLRKDLKKLLKCTGIIMLYDWNKSKGARLELTVAQQLNYKVFNFDIEENILIEHT